MSSGFESKFPLKHKFKKANIMVQDFQIEMHNHATGEERSWWVQAHTPEEALGKALRRKLVACAMMSEEPFSFVVKDRYSTLSN